MRSNPLYWFRFLLIPTVLRLGLSTAVAQFIDTSADRVKTPLTISLKQIGTLKPRSTKDIESSRITVGCETLDRDFTDFQAYKAYLPPLGVKKIRLQAGWAKCEKVKGVYDWKWLDEIIDFAAANGVEPWLETSYGNPIYEGGGRTGLLNSLMTSPEGYAAYDRWVEALVTRYKDRVKEWEIWNEPDHPMQKITPETTAELNIRTADIIKRIQPDAKIAAFALATHTDTVYLDRALKVLADQKKLDLFTWVSYHSYAFRPEQSYKGVNAFKRVLAKYSPKLRLRQGENGAPSGYIPSYALDKYYWTEYSQAKYDMRRLLGDLGRDIETSVFTIIDIRYGGDPPVLNMKGLIQSDLEKTVIRPKVAYYAVQNVASIFDNRLELRPEMKIMTTGDSVSVFGYQQKAGKKQLISVWLDAKMPTNLFQTTPIDLTVENGNFDTPVWVDLLTGHVYEIPKAQWSKSGTTYTFRNIPVYDSPILVAEKALVLIN
ncbi:beta-galactosidase [Spirosoma soli]|uniref:Beta-galactosidase n=1 Tax=Spirosoma soli TaxID=1770529 RepID=A0ABW5M2D1_9BACT